MASIDQTKNTSDNLPIDATTYLSVEEEQLIEDLS